MDRVIEYFNEIAEAVKNLTDTTDYAG